MTERFQTIVFLVRHGQTNNTYQVERSLDGERILSEEGKVQARRMGEYLQLFSPSSIHSSPFKRTIETAQIIQKAANIPGEIVLSKDLSEVFTKFEYENRPKTEAHFLQRLTVQHPGEQLVVVSHQLPIEESLIRLGFDHSEIDPPCQMGEGYRLVFAGDVPVECLKICPSL